MDEKSLHRSLWKLLLWIFPALIPSGLLSAEPLPNFGFQKFRSRSVIDESKPRPKLANFRGLTRKELAQRPAQFQAYQKLLQDVRGVKINLSRLSGGASNIYSLKQSLTAPVQGETVTLARNFLTAQRDLFLLSEAEISALEVKKEFTSPFNGIRHVHFKQVINGIDVLNCGFQVHLTKQGELISLNGHVLPGLDEGAISSQPRVSASRALESAMKILDIQGAVPAIIQQGTGPTRNVEFLTGQVFQRNVTGNLVYFPIGPGKVQLGWRFFIQEKQNPFAYMVISGTDSALPLCRYNLTSTQNPQGLVLDADDPQPDSPVSGNASPPVVNREDRNFDGGEVHDSIGQAVFDVTDAHFDWWAGNFTQDTQSNNVFAGEDRNGDDVPIASDGQGTDSEDFSFGPADTTALLLGEPSSYTDEAVVNLFYWCNRIHDFLYFHGFDEGAGNFQTNNLGLGGLDNDQVLALAQVGADDGVANNALFTTLPDGGLNGFGGLMQMFEFDGAITGTTLSPKRDSALDAGIIIHEFTHGLTNRLIGDATGLTGFQGGSMGEGWSDFMSLIMLSQPTDDPDANYVSGGYILDKFGQGIRSEPYSTNPSIFTRSFASIVFTPSSGFFLGPIPGDTPFEDTHLAGEVWCNALWIARRNIQQQLNSATGANSRMARLVIEGAKLTPINPTFLDARDAIILADTNTFAGADLTSLWEAFAVMGMGINASNEDNEDRLPVEDFTPDPTFSGKGNLFFDQSLTVGGTLTATYILGETVTVTVSDGNVGGDSVTVTLAGGTLGDQETLTLSETATGSLTFSVQVQTERKLGNAVVTGDGILQTKLGESITVTYTDADDGTGQPATLTRFIRIGVQVTVLSENFDDGTADGWSLESPWAVAAESPASGSNSLSDSPGGNYDPSVIFVDAETPEIDLTGIFRVNVSYAQIFDMDTSDTCNFNSDINSGILTINNFTDQQADFQTVQKSARQFDNKGAFKLLFRAIYLSSGNGKDGWNIDDVVITGVDIQASSTPVINSFSPTTALTGQTTTVTMSGSNFTNGADMFLFFDNGIQAQNINVLSPTTATLTITVPEENIAPPSFSRPISVSIETSGGSSQADYQFNSPRPPTATGGGGGGCFVATASYGSPLSKKIRALTSLRDGHLRKTSLGKDFVRTYYANSPVPSRQLEKSNVLRAFSRSWLSPIVKATQVAVPRHITD